jgi:cytochrome b
MGTKFEQEDDDDKREGWLGELHEATANLLLVFVATHVIYLLLFKRQLALFMLFRPSP